MQLAVVKWKDATNFNNWATAEEVEKSEFKIVYSAGFLVTDIENKTTVALLVSEDKKNFSNWVNIPTGNVMECAIIKDVDWEVPNG